MMKEGHALKLIYKMTSGTDPESTELTARYEVLYFFGEGGPMSLELMDEVSRTVFQRPATLPVTFKSLDELKEFALGVCQKVHGPEVFVLSVQDYNIGVEAARDVRAFRELFRRYGLNIPNPEIINKGPGLISRLFKK